MKAFKKITALALTLAMLMTSMLTTSVFAELKFNDVDDSTAYSAAIYNLVSEGIINGYDNGDGTSSFKPDATITRAEFAKIVVMTREGANAAFNQTTTNFPDMAGSEWAIPYVAHATGLGIINGYEDGTFRPDTYITRAQAMTMINRVLNRIPEDADDLLSNMNVWPDCNPGDWFYLAVQEATNSHAFQYKTGNYETWTGMNKKTDWTRYEN